MEQRLPQLYISFIWDVVTFLLCFTVSLYFCVFVCVLLLWTPAQRKRASMLYFANVFLKIFFMAALFSGPGERKFAKVLHVVDLECH